MADSTGNIYYATTRVPRHPENIHPHIWPPLHCEATYHSYLPVGENIPQNISLQLMHPCPGPLDSNILPGPSSDEEASPATICHSIVYPESSQRTTSSALSPCPSDASRLHDVSPCDLTTLHIVDAPPHGAQVFRRGSWPSHAHPDYSTWTPPPRTIRSPVSEPPESTEDDSYQESDGEETTRMSPMMNQFQILPSRNVNFPPRYAHRAQALQPSVMTFQLSETMLQPVDDPENRHMLRSLLDMSIIADDVPEFTHSPPSTLPSLPPTSSFGNTSLQGLSGMRFQNDGEKVIETNQLRVPIHPTASPSPHGAPGSGDQRPPDTKPQKTPKMHQCAKCDKLFPRPSGLATHMNTHSGAKPYKCIIPDCGKTFAVRSNAKRHLRTHGIDPSAVGILGIPKYTVGFEKPMVTQVHDAGKQPSRLKWIAHSMSSHGSGWFHPGSSSPAVGDSSRTGIAFQTNMALTAPSVLSNGSDDDYDEAVFSSVIDGRQYQGDYRRGSDDGYSGTFPNYGAHPG